MVSWWTCRSGQAELTHWMQMELQSCKQCLVLTRPGTHGQALILFCLQPVQSLSEGLLAYVRSLFLWALPACLRFVRKKVKEIQPTLDANLARTAMRLFAALLEDTRVPAQEDDPATSDSSAPASGMFMT